MIDSRFAMCYNSVLVKVGNCSFNFQWREAVKRFNDDDFSNFMCWEMFVDNLIMEE